MSDSERQERAEQRRKTMTIRRVSLEDSDIDYDPVFGAEALALTTQLTKQSWAISGRKFPTYKRSDMPVKFVPFDSE